MAADFAKTADKAYFYAYRQSRPDDVPGLRQRISNEVDSQIRVIARCLKGDPRFAHQSRLILNGEALEHWVHEMEIWKAQFKNMYPCSKMQARPMNRTRDELLQQQFDMIYSRIIHVFNLAEPPMLHEVDWLILLEQYAFLKEMTRKWNKKRLDMKKYTGGSSKRTALNRNLDTSDVPHLTAAKPNSFSHNWSFNRAYYQTMYDTGEQTIQNAFPSYSELPPSRFKHPGSFVAEKGQIAGRKNALEEKRPAAVKEKEAEEHQALLETAQRMIALFPAFPAPKAQAGAPFAIIVPKDTITPI